VGKTGVVGLAATTRRPVQREVRPSKYS
jgi:hypothetical protein